MTHPPSDPYSLALREAKTLHKANRLPQAVTHYERLLRTAPADPQLLYFLGSAYASLNKIPEAIETLKRSLAVSPDNINVVEMLGSTYIRAGKHENALPLFRKAEQISGSPDAMQRLANTLLQCARYLEAKPVYERLMRVSPESKVYIGLTLCLINLGDATAAEKILADRARAFPQDAEIHRALGTLLAQQERWDEAERAYRSASLLDPRNPEAARGLANCLHRQGRFGEAEALYREALRARPDDAATLCQLGEALIELSRLDEAQSMLDRAHLSEPSNASVLTALGRVAELRGDPAGAIVWHDRALALVPGHYDALTNRGTAKRFMGNFQGALADYEQALALSPGFPPAAASKGLALLTLGRLDEAWPYYRSRIRARAGALDLTGNAPWDGCSLAGRDVLVWAEYGLGDEILFASLLPDLNAITARCTVVCAPRLCALLRRSFPQNDFIPSGSPLPRKYDVQMPLTDAAQLLRPTLASFPRHAGYLLPDPDCVRTLRQRYQRGTRPLVGISWRSASGPTGRFKSTDLTQWRDILAIGGLSFVSLQYGKVDEEVADIVAGTGADLICDALIDSTRDMDAFAAQVAAMDLVISVSNTTVHVAGAAGKPVWVLTPKGPGAHWYWFLDRSDNPWYPSAVIFRQRECGDWSAPLAEVAQKLSHWSVR